MINCGLGVREDRIFTVCIYDDTAKCIKFGTLFRLRMADSLPSTKFMDTPLFLQAASLLPVRFLNRSVRRLGSWSFHRSSSSLNSSSRTASCHCRSQHQRHISDQAPSNRTLDIATVRNNRGSFSIGFLEYYCLVNSNFTLRSWTPRLRISERHITSRVRYWKAHNK
jgi:hypothetical protein